MGDGFRHWSLHWTGKELVGWEAGKLLEPRTHQQSALCFIKAIALCVAGAGSF